MKYITHITAILLGLIFIVFGMNFFLKFLPVPTPPAGSHAAMFMGGMFASGFLAFVKVLEILGGLFVAIPQTRHLGLLILGPIIVNIFAFNYFFLWPEGPPANARFVVWLTGPDSPPRIPPRLCSIPLLERLTSSVDERFFISSPA